MKSYTELFSSSVWGKSPAHPGEGLVPALWGHFWVPAWVTLPWLQQRYQRHPEAELSRSWQQGNLRVLWSSQTSCGMDHAQRQVHLRYSHKSNSEYKKRAVHNQPGTHAAQFHNWTVGLARRCQFRCSGSCPAQLELILHFLPPLPGWPLLAPQPGTFPPSAQSFCHSWASPWTQGHKVSYCFSGPIPDFWVSPQALL